MTGNVSGTTTGSSSGIVCLALYQGQDDWQCIGDRLTGSISETECLVVIQTACKALCCRWSVKCQVASAGVGQSVAESGSDIVWQ